ncbi:MAG: beta-propeller fold lactonase family protein [Spartobacteria bacterium]
MTNRARNNEVVAFTRATDGTLTEGKIYSTGGNGIGVDFDTQGGLTLSADHRFLYACNPGSDNVTVFAVDGARLSLIQKIYAGDQPLSITLSGNLAYVLDGSVAGNGVTGFTVGNNGRLTAIPNSFRDLSSPIAVPGEALFSPNGRNLIVTGKVGSIIDVFNVRSDGLLSKPVQNASFGLRPFAAAFKQDGNLLVLESGLPTPENAAVSSYDLLRPSGTLTVITGSEKNGQTDGCWIVITNDQQYAYTANFVSGTISSYALNGSGSVSLINAAAAFSGLTSQPTDLAFDSETKYLYNLLRGTGGISSYRVETDGSLTFVGLFGVGSALPVADGASGLAAY